MENTKHVLFGNVNLRVSEITVVKRPFVWRECVVASLHIVGPNLSQLGKYLSDDVMSRCVPLQVHRGLMLLAVSLTCVAFTLPFLYRGGWSKVSHPPPAIHPLPFCLLLAGWLLLVLTSKIHSSQPHPLLPKKPMTIIAVN